MRKPTPEQREKAKNRRASIAKLVAKISQFSEAQKVEFLNRVGTVVTVEGHPLSMTNLFLVVSQLEGTLPTMVGGFRQWRKRGRVVRKGERALAIWIPKCKKGEDTNENEEGEDKRNSFFLGNVFDVSQTEPIAA